MRKRPEPAEAQVPLAMLGEPHGMGSTVGTCSRGLFAGLHPSRFDIPEGKGLRVAWGQPRGDLWLCLGRGGRGTR